MPSRKSSFGVMNSGTQIGIIVGIVVLVVVGIVIFMMYKPSTAPSKQLNFIRIVNNRINTSPTLTGKLTDISNTITPMEVNNIIQLKNGTFAAVELSTNQIWTCDTLSGNKTDWTHLSGKGTPGEKTPFPLIALIQLNDGTFAAIEYYSNVVWTCGTTLSGNATDWTSLSDSKTPMQVRTNIIQLKNGTFAAIEYYSNQVWTCGTKLSGNKKDWTHLSGKGTPGEKTPFPLIWITQLPDYTFAAIEYYSNVVWTCGTTLSGNATDWTNTVTGISDLNTTRVVVKTLQSISTMYI